MTNKRLRKTQTNLYFIYLWLMKSNVGGKFQPQFNWSITSRCLLLYFQLLILLISSTTYGQSPFSNHYYFSNKFIAAQSILQNNDGTYLFVGSADTIVAGASGSQSGILKKLDSNGNLLWTQYYNFANAYNLSFNKIKKTLDGNYVVVGVIDYGFGVGPTFQDVFFAKLDTMGNTLWMKSYGGIATDIGFDVKELSNGDFLIQSSFGVLVNQDIFNAFQLIKTNAFGDSLWTQLYYHFDGLEQFPVAADQTSDQGFCSVGMKLTANSETVGYIVKTDSTGLEHWNLVIDSTINNELIGVTAGTNTFTVFGNRNIGTAEEPFLAELDLLGNINWMKTINEPNVHLSSVTKTYDNGNALTGVEMLGINSKVILIKIDSSGNKLWKKSFPQLNIDMPTDIRQTLDSGYIITGNTYDNLSYYIFALKTNDSLSVTFVSTELLATNISVFPNPVHQLLELKLNDFDIKTIQSIAITDILGSEVIMANQFDLLNKSIDVTSIESGLYFLKLIFANKQEPKLIKFVKL